MATTRVIRQVVAVVVERAAVVDAVTTGTICKDSVPPDAPCQVVVDTAAAVGRLLSAKVLLVSVSVLPLL